MHYKAYCSRSDTKLTEKELKRELVGVRSSIHVKKAALNDMADFSYMPLFETLTF